MNRTRINFPLNVKARISIPVRITDINYGNHVGNDAFVGIIHEARVLWLQTGNYTELNIGGPGLIMADLAVEFKSESFYGDILIIEIAINEITKGGFNVYFSISTIRTGQELMIAKAKTQMVCYDYTTRNVTTIPLQFLEFLNK